jgi:hypothetical protein
MRDLEVMREISCIGREQGRSSGSFAPIAASRLAEGKVSHGTGDGKDETLGSLDCAAHGETVIRSVEMPWLWE